MSAERLFAAPPAAVGGLGARLRGRFWRVFLWAVRSLLEEAQEESRPLPAPALPMDADGPLSPKANAFSIAALISAAEQAGSAAFAHPSPGAAPRLRAWDKMHYSTVTREMEGNPLRRRRARPRPASRAHHSEQKGAKAADPQSSRLWPPELAPVAA